MPCGQPRQNRRALIESRLNQLAAAESVMVQLVQAAPLSAQCLPPPPPPHVNLPLMPEAPVVHTAMHTSCIATRMCLPEPHYPPQAPFQMAGGYTLHQMEYNFQYMDTPAAPPCAGVRLQARNIQVRPRLQEFFSWDL